MISPAAQRGPVRPAVGAGPPVGQALAAFASVAAALLVLVLADVAGLLRLAGAAASQFGVVATTTFVIAAVAAAYRAWAVRSIMAGAITAVLLLPGALWSWLTFVAAVPIPPLVSSIVVLGAAGLALLLLSDGVRRARCLEVFGGLGAAISGMVAGLVHLDPTTADIGAAALLAAVAGMICLYGLLADLEAAEHRSLAQLLESRQQLASDASRVEDLLHDLRSGLLAIEAAIGSFDDDLAAPLQAEAARLRRLTLTGDRTVGLFDVAAGLRNLVAAAGPTGAGTLLRAPASVMAWGEESEILAVVDNLLSNARRHGDGRPILVEVAQQGQAIQVVVTSGGSLPPGDPEVIFGRGVTTHPDGRGLGLARARMLAEVNGAELGLGPAAPGTTSFVLSLRSGPPVALAS